MNRYSVEASLDYLPRTAGEAHQMLNRAYYHLRNQEKAATPYETLQARAIIDSLCKKVTDDLQEVA